MSREDWGFLICLFILSAAISVPVFLIGGSFGSRSVREAAIEANVAEWTIDAKTGQREFRFKTPETDK